MLLLGQNDMEIAARTIFKSASVGLLKAKVKLFTYENDVEIRSQTNCSPPTFFWPRENFDYFEHDWQSGIFSDTSKRIRCHAFGVTFALAGIEAICASCAGLDPEPKLRGHAFGVDVASQPQSATRAPAVKIGRPPDDKAILTKAEEMKQRGLSGRQIAATMRLEIGFENAGTTLVREAIRGRYPSGRPKKSAQ